MVRWISRVGLLATLALTGAACGDEEPGGHTGAGALDSGGAGGGAGSNAGGCILNDEPFICVDYTGSGYQASLMKTACEQGGTYFASGCAQTGQLGTCVAAPGDPGEQTLHFLPGHPDPVDKLKETCETGGFTWIP